MQKVGSERDFLSVVASFVENSIESIIAIWAILKAGAYLPIDPVCPKDRFDWMIRDAGGSLLLTSQHGRAVVSENYLVVLLDGEETSG